jgi:hypothetical protein
MKKNKVFGEFTFNTGWKAKTDITFFGSGFNIAVTAKAYSEKDAITPEQEKAFDDFNGNKEGRLKTAEKLLTECAGSNASKRFVPRKLLFKRDGGYALLLDDKEDPDNGMAVVFAPKAGLLTQDEYL